MDNYNKQTDVAMEGTERCCFVFLWIVEVQLLLQCKRRFHTELLRFN